MSTHIQWADEVWNPTTGCTRVSEGCRHCYAETMAHRLAQIPATASEYADLTRITHGRPQWTGQVRCLPERLEIPLRWRKPRRVFVNSMSDLFHENIDFMFIEQVFEVMGRCPQHQFLVLTKRPSRMLEYTRPRFRRWTYRWPIPTVWLGVSAEDQETADERIPLLLECPAASRFVSLEPLLGPIDLTCLTHREDRVTSRETWINALAGAHFTCCHTEAACVDVETEKLDLILIGGESGPGARPCDVRWIESLIAQCRDAGTACFVKQVGARPYRSPDHDGDTGYEIRLRDRKGGDMEEWPANLRVREMP